MTTVSKRELNQQTAAVLARVTDSEDVLVTERGVPRWRVASARLSETALSRLERAGRYAPPSTTPAPWPAPSAEPTYTLEAVDALLDETRGEH
ncbi:type II toxin-antitoxin system Phd/YefM family antitoxin [Brachybacterium saurashtrense]|uniref:Type II toxin-antitoxin system prevent-host-death family antitoxin n=1 Tax=Brachybacterium saurashtrense TaxID=556288 RepID=A0A345YRU5_9MICO|nr:type II toxin-antitoxin system prevent-host-death family antitoxin [Brachybacterium saurashtrense]AXK46647.1 type II toxin-antitoxin system prevent-host-death family antitoxin [Brachybacterium saurashtrense]RRR22361.1 type II toxin-antitoxin system prevent-host-death family antitoxin [Brachybacterium saurashtrense]